MIADPQGAAFTASKFVPENKGPARGRRRGQRRLRFSGRPLSAPCGAESGTGPPPHGHADVRCTVLDVIGIPGAMGDVSESADVPVALAE